MPFGNINVDTVTTTTPGGILGGGNASLMKNRIINGAMVIDQRNAGASVTPASNAYMVDRWQYFSTQASKFTAQQNAGSVTPPVGFTNYLGMTVASAVTVGASDTFGIRQHIEGYNVADLGWGTANAKTITISAWVRSSLTGTFGGVLQNSAQDRNYPFTFTISSANTWTQISVTVAGDTSGTWLTTNGAGISVIFNLGSGSTYSGTAGSWSSTLYFAPTGAVSIVGTASATFYITGVQLEVGSSATGFEYRQYTTELQLCQRYLPVLPIAPLGQYLQFQGSAYSGAYSFFTIPFPVTVRTAPTGMTYTGTIANISVYNGATPIYLIGLILDSANTKSGVLRTQVSSGQTTGYCMNFVSEQSAATQILFTGCEL
jgi:hypothetical protein